MAQGCDARVMTYLEAGLACGFCLILGVILGKYVDISIRLRREKEPKET